MHDSLLIVPNASFYKNRIESHYVQPNDKTFLYLDSPFIFIDVYKGKQEFVGTSCKNSSEVASIKEFL
jgi:hypothetical protein